MTKPIELFVSFMSRVQGGDWALDSVVMTIPHKMSSSDDVIMLTGGIAKAVAEANRQVTGVIDQRIEIRLINWIHLEKENEDIRSKDEGIRESISDDSNTENASDNQS